MWDILLLAKTDIEQAFRNVPVHPQDRNLQGIMWSEQFFIDTVLPVINCKLDTHLWGFRGPTFRESFNVAMSHTLVILSVTLHLNIDWVIIGRWWFWGKRGIGVKKLFPACESFLCIFASYLSWPTTHCFKIIILWSVFRCCLSVFRSYFGIPLGVPLLKQSTCQGFYCHCCQRCTYYERLILLSQGQLGGFVCGLICRSQS